MSKFTACKHSHHTELKGQWGPHTIKIVCSDCNKWIKWGSKKIVCDSVYQMY